MPVNFNTQLPTGFPTPPNPTLNQYAFPNDLTTGNSGSGAKGSGNRNYYTQINFVSYRQGLNNTQAVVPGGGILLPIPKQLNDQTVMVWSPISLTETAAAVAGAAAGAAIGSVAGPVGGIAGALAGAFTGSQLAGGVVQGINTVSPLTGGAVNPFLYMLFKQPDFKEFQFRWTLAPNTPEETNTLATIIKFFKFHMLPEISGLLMYYPSIALVKLFPDDKFTFKLRPCAITNVIVDYTAGGGPSFFRDTGAPTVVNLTVVMKEIQIWDKNSFNSIG